MIGTSRGNWLLVFTIFAALPAAACADSAGSKAGRSASQRYTPQLHSKHSDHTPLSASAPRTPVVARIAIIIDDLGESHGGGLRAVNLPGAVALAFLPGTRHGELQAELAHRRGKEVLLHLPLQPEDARQRHPGGLGLRSSRAEVAAYLAAALDSVPHARGVNNHQGSLLTEMPEHMDWLMNELRLRPQLYFVDSRTSDSSIAYRMARARSVPAAERQVFLDSVRGEPAVRAAFRQLLAVARQRGQALAIGHPYPETFAVLERELPRLAPQGVELVAPSHLIAGAKVRGRSYKQLKLSPSLSLATRTRGPGLLATRSAAAR